MHDTYGCPRPTVADRQDQAIGRIIRLLPRLSVQELDALADRLGRKAQGVFVAGSTMTQTVHAVTADDHAVREPAMAETEPRVDLVGQ